MHVMEIGDVRQKYTMGWKQGWCENAVDESNYKFHFGFNSEREIFEGKLF
jgi:hypothetical protein